VLDGKLIIHYNHYSSGNQGSNKNQSSNTNQASGNYYYRGRHPITERIQIQLSNMRWDAWIAWEI
jgi:hypothetical protein